MWKLEGGLRTVRQGAVGKLASCLGSSSNMPVSKGKALTVDPSGSTLDNVCGFADGSHTVWTLFLRYEFSASPSEAGSRGTEPCLITAALSFWRGHLLKGRESAEDA